MIDKVIATMLGTLAFVILLNAPRKEYFFCAVNGAIGWITFQLLTWQGTGVATASLGATLILTIAARMLSIIRKCPATIFLVTGIFTLVPGSGIYYTAYYLIMDDFAQFGAKGVETFKIAGAIVIGIVFGFTVPQSWFNIGRKRKDVGK